VLGSGDGGEASARPTGRRALLARKPKPRMRLPAP